MFFNNDKMQFKSEGQPWSGRKQILSLLRLETWEESGGNDGRRETWESSENNNSQAEDFQKKKRIHSLTTNHVYKIHLYFLYHDSHD